ncbi:hypothetical protein HYW82_02430 [Candidatus Peregrinibacteria bacterium]|nr:hypothetical protein [Candidatus Peregrinibacteria bacterium]
MIVRDGRMPYEEELIEKIENQQPGTLPDFSPDQLGLDDRASIPNLTNAVDLTLAHSLIADLRSNEKHPEKAALKYIELFNYEKDLRTYFDKVNTLMSRTRDTDSSAIQLKLAMIMDRCCITLTELRKALQAFENSQIAKKIDGISDSVRSKTKDILARDLQLSEFIENGFPDGIRRHALKEIINAMDQESRKHFGRLCDEKAAELRASKDVEQEEKLAKLLEDYDFIVQHNNIHIVSISTALSVTIQTVWAIKDKNFELRQPLQQITRLQQDSTFDMENNCYTTTISKLNILESQLAQFMEKPRPRPGIFSREYRQWRNEIRTLKNRFDGIPAQFTCKLQWNDSNNPTGQELDKFKEAIAESRQVLVHASSANKIVQELASSGYMAKVEKRNTWMDCANLLQSSI